MHTRIYRSRTEKVVGGVCGGLGRYLSLDPTIIRLYFVLLSLGSGIGVLIYIALWIILPEEPVEEMLPEEGTEGRLEGSPGQSTQEISERVRGMGEDIRQAIRNPNPQAGKIIGIALIGAGIVFFIDNLNISWLWWLDLDVLWPALLIIGGATMLLRRPGG